MFCYAAELRLRLAIINVLSGSFASLHYNQAEIAGG
jgi:hypothetical protein